MKLYKVDVVDYDPSWNLLYAEEVAFLKLHIQEFNTVIEHIGSTAFPGLSAKLIIDIGTGIHVFEQSDRMVQSIR